MNEIIDTKTEKDVQDIIERIKKLETKVEYLIEKQKQMQDYYCWVYNYIRRKENENWK